MSFVVVDSFFFFTFHSLGFLFSVVVSSTLQDNRYVFSAAPNLQVVFMHFYDLGCVVFLFFFK